MGGQRNEVIGSAGNLKPCFDDNTQFVRRVLTEMKLEWKIGNILLIVPCTKLRSKFRLGSAGEGGAGVGDGYVLRRLSFSYMIKWRKPSTT